MILRRFSDERLRLCENWAATVVTTETWHEKGPVGEGESQSMWVENETGLRGVAKPGQPKRDNERRAAHEKIAFDLAHLLELPVPPVVLWDRGDTVDAGLRWASISARAFAQGMKWNEAQAQNLLSQTAISSVLSIASAMRVFHTWLADSDRKADHVQVDLASPEAALGVAFIDHAFSMSHVWKAANCDGGVCRSDVLPVPEDPDAIRATADRIAGLAPASIEEIVNRVPLGFLPEPERGHIISNLLGRRGRLKALLGVP